MNRLTHERVNGIKGKFKIGDRVRVMSAKGCSDAIKIALKSEVAKHGVIIGIYPNILQVRLDSGGFEAFTWGDCATGACVHIRR